LVCGAFGTLAAMDVKAVLFDFGGVLSTSPFEAFARYERERGLPDRFLRGLNAANHHDNAWAHLERGDVTLDEFCRLYEQEALAAGHEVVGRDVLALLRGDLRPEMITAVRRCSERLLTGLLTNNFVGMSAADGFSEMRELLDLFDAVVESSQVGVRKPEPRFYELACDALGIEPAQAVFLDDLGVNLKPAKAMGMQTIKVIDPAAALAELEAAVGFPVS
jgi:putative hydrolase of the HAD superfamily